MGVNGCQGTPWSEELDGKELDEAAGDEYDLEPRGSALSYTRIQHNPSKHLRCGIILVLKGAVFCLIFCTAVLMHSIAQYLTHSFVSFIANYALRVVEFASSCIF